MTQEQKDLLLKDLCARVPYGVKYMRYSWDYDTDQELPVIETLECADKDGYINHRRVYTVDDIKPYLFPLSSMTEEQKNDLIKNLKSNISVKNEEISFWNLYTANRMDQWKWVFEWCDKNHFDYRGLIPMGLAIDATGLNIY